jgi:uncharacterized membrane protein (DUF4010 family)
MQLDLVFWRLTLAAGLGLLVGLQREHAATRLAGLRTFPLITLFGSIMAMVAQTAGAWVIPAGLLALGAVVASGSWLGHRTEEADPGITTEIAILTMYGIGAYMIAGEPAVGTALGGGIAVLLAFKGEMHTAVARLEESDVKAIMQFALVSLVILPALPDRTFGPYQVLNPRQIWWMVVLIVGIGLTGYIAHKFVPQKAGATVAGVLGGLVSSTATTVSCARRVAEGAIEPGWAATVILLASIVVFARLLVEVAVASPQWIGSAGPPLAALMVLMSLLAGPVWRRNHTSMPPAPLKNPSQLRWAVLFAFVYGIILLVAAAVKHHLGEQALYLLAIVSGLTDVDAITLSTARLVNTGVLDPASGWRIVVAAALSNVAGKAVFAATLAGRRLVLRILLPYAATLLAGAALILYR